MEFEGMIAHRIDLSTKTIVLSEYCMDLKSECKNWLISKIKKAYHSTKKISTTFQSDSFIFQLSLQYHCKEITLKEYSQQVVQYIYDRKQRYGLLEDSTIMIGSIVLKERSYIIIMDHAHQSQMLSHTTQIEGLVVNELQSCNATISSSLLKKDYVCFIEVSSQTVSIIEEQKEINQGNYYFYQDYILQCEKEVPLKDAMKTITNTCEKVIQDYALKKEEVMPKIKQYVKDCIEEKEAINIEKLSDEIFIKEPLAKQSFQQKIKDIGMVHPISVEHAKLSKSEKVQKMKTDQGIELSIPIDFMSNKEYVEIHNHDDGTISIQLKNIHTITSK